MPGFYGDPLLENGEWDNLLVTSWYRMGVFMPFFRAHSFIGNQMREPWEFDKQTLDEIRNSIILRYRLLIYIYTQFYLYHKTSKPIISPITLETEDGLKFHNGMNFGSEIMVSLNP